MMNRTPVPTELHELLGDPTEVQTTAGGATTWIWEIDPGGDGVLIARAGGRDTGYLLEQLRVLQRFAEECHLRPRRVIASSNMSGVRRFHERPDLLAVERAITDKGKWCQFVGCTDITRVSRAREGVELFLDFLAESGVDLRLASAGFEPHRPTSLLAGLLTQMTPADRVDLVQRLRIRGGATQRRQTRVERSEGKKDGTPVRNHGR